MIFWDNTTFYSWKVPHSWKYSSVLKAKSNTHISIKNEICARCKVTRFGRFPNETTRGGTLLQSDRLVILWEHILFICKYEHKTEKQTTD